MPEKDLKKTKNFLFDEDIWSEPLTLPRGAFLLQPGDIEQHLYIIIEGAVRIYYSGKNQEHCIRLGYKNNILNALPSFLSGKPSDLCLQTLKKTSYRKAHKSAILNARNASAENTALWIEMLQELFLQQYEREVDLLTSSPEERYKRVLLRSPQLFQEIPHKYIAEYLRMTPETLSRLKKS